MSLAGSQKNIWTLLIVHYVHLTSLLQGHAGCLKAMNARGVCELGLIDHNVSVCMYVLVWVCMRVCRGGVSVCVTVGVHVCGLCRCVFVCCMWCI